MGQENQLFSKDFAQDILSIFKINSVLSCSFHCRTVNVTLSWDKTIDCISHGTGHSSTTGEQCLSFPLEYEHVQTQCSDKFTQRKHYWLNNVQSVNLNITGSALSVSSPLLWASLDPNCVRYIPRHSVDPGWGPSFSTQALLTVWEMFNLFLAHMVLVTGFPQTQVQQTIYVHRSELTGQNMDSWNTLTLFLFMQWLTVRG